MEAIQFVNNYLNYLEEISQVIKPELLPILDELFQIDPHDLIRPDSYFDSENSARGYVWSMFIKRVNKDKLSRRGSFQPWNVIQIVGVVKAKQISIFQDLLILCGRNI